MRRLPPGEEEERQKKLDKDSSLLRPAIDPSFRDTVEWLSCMVGHCGCAFMPRDAASKILFVVGFLFGMVVYTSFTAQIVSTLSTAQSIKSVRELLDYGKIRWENGRKC